MNWKRIEQIIEETEMPLSLLFIVIANSKNIKNSDLEFVYRIYIKHHYEILLNYPIFNLFISMQINIHPTILKFYRYYNNLIISHNNLIVFKNSFNKYTKLNIKELEIKIENEINIFKAYFDASYTSNNFNNKLLHYFSSKEKNFNIDDETVKRLHDSLKFIGIKFIEYFKIPVLSFTEYNNLSNINKIKFIKTYYEMTLATLKFINNNIKKNTINKNLLLNLGQPVNIDIKTINNLNSETENGDFVYFI